MRQYWVQVRWCGMSELEIASCLLSVVGCNFFPGVLLQTGAYIIIYHECLINKY
jgi:hypothetical protein